MDGDKTRMAAAGVQPTASFGATAVLPRICETQTRSHRRRAAVFAADGRRVELERRVAELESLLSARDALLSNCAQGPELQTEVELRL